MNEQIGRSLDFLMKSPVKRLWKNNILPIVDKSLNYLNLEKQSLILTWLRTSQLINIFMIIYMKLFGKLKAHKQQIAVTLPLLFDALPAEIALLEWPYNVNLMVV